MIKVHDIVRILDSAISARARFHLTDKSYPLRVCAGVSIQILTFVALIVTVGETLPAFLTVRVTDTSRAMPEIVFSNRLVYSTF